MKTHLQVAVRTVSTFVISSRCARPHSWTVAALLAASALSCGDDDPVDTSTPTTLEIVAGDGQNGVVSQALAEPLVVRVLDPSGVPVAGVTVTWAAQGGGSVSPDTVPTDSDGLASTQRFLGPTVGDQTTTAAVDGVEGSPVTFTSRAVDEGGPPNPL